MYPISSSLTSQVREFNTFRGTAADLGFVLGGNWDYQQGSFDCALDRENKVWLRLPFDVTLGSIDGEASDTGAVIRFREPYVLKHVYEEGPDRGARASVLGAVITQFSDPEDPDAAIEPHWVSVAQVKLREVERLFPV